MQNIIFLKIPTLRIKKYYFYFADRPTHGSFFFFFFFAVLPVDKKINLIRLNRDTMNQIGGTIKL